MDAGGDPEVVLIDGNPSWRGAVSEALEARGLAVFDTDADLDDVLEEIAPLWAPVFVVGPAVVGNVLRTVAMISALDASVLVLGSATDELELLLTLASGATGFLAADAPPAQIAGAADALRSGRVVLPDAAGPALLEVLRGCGRGIKVTGADGRRYALTQREWEVLVLHRQDHGTAEIAARLVVSPVTVRTHILALRQKLARSIARHS